MRLSTPLFKGRTYLVTPGLKSLDPYAIDVCFLIGLASLGPSAPAASSQSTTGSTSIYPSRRGRPAQPAARHGGNAPSLGAPRPGGHAVCTLPLYWGQALGGLATEYLNLAIQKALPRAGRVTVGHKHIFPHFGPQSCAKARRLFASSPGERAVGKGAPVDGRRKKKKKKKEVIATPGPSKFRNKPVKPLGAGKG